MSEAAREKRVARAAKLFFIIFVNLHISFCQFMFGANFSIVQQLL